MQFSSRLTIATHILLCIEIFKDDYKITSNFLAGSIHVNPVIVRNILGLLSSAGIVEIKAGVGGASLAKSPDEITMLDVFKAVEKEESLFHFHENPNANCPVGRNVHAVLDSKLDNIQTAMENELAKIGQGNKRKNVIIENIQNLHLLRQVLFYAILQKVKP